VPDCLHAIETRSLNQSFAVVRGMFEELAGPEMSAALKLFRSRADHAAYSVGFRDVVPPPSFLQVPRWHQTIMAVEAAAVHAKRLARHALDYPPRITALIADGLRRSAAEYEEALVQQTHVRMEIDWAIRVQLIWLTPAATGPAPATDTTGNPAMNAPWSYAGLPTVSVPFARTDDGMPISVQLIAEERGEDRLLAAATYCETAASHDRRLPPVP
jgi:aspartyl-tRNA(Asn)/glutamyl-tRNA(Gln) amidotransferase subunit A